MNIRYTTLLLTLAVLASCSFHCMDRSSPIGTGLEPPDRMEMYSGNLQSGICGKKATAPLAVQIFTAGNNPSKGLFVEFVAVKGSAVFAQSLVTTDNNGIARAYFIYGSKSDSIVVQAVYQGIKGSPVVFRLKSLGGLATDFRLLMYPDRDLTAGTLFPLKVLVLDQFNNPSPGANVKFRVTSGKSFFAQSTLVTDTSGTVTNYWRMDTVAGTYTQSEITVDGSSSSPINLTARVVPAPPASIYAYAGDNQAGFIDTRTEPLTVCAKDKYGNYVLRFDPVSELPDGGSLFGRGLKDSSVVPMRFMIPFVFGHTTGDYRVRLYVDASKGSAPAVFTLRAYTTVALSPIWMISNAPSIQWTSTPDASFQSYQVLRDSVPNLTKTSPVLATITDRNVTSFADTTVVQGIYNHYYYRILISFANGDKLLTNEEYIVP